MKLFEHVCPNCKYLNTDGEILFTCPDCSCNDITNTEVLKSAEEAYEVCEDVDLDGELYEGEEYPSLEDMEGA